MYVREMLYRTWKTALGLTVPEEVFLHNRGIAGIALLDEFGPGSGVVDVDGESPAGGRLEGDFAEGGGEGGEEFLGELCGGERVRIGDGIGRCLLDLRI